MNSKTAKMLRREATRMAAQLLGTRPQTQKYAARQYKNVQFQEAQINDLTGRPFRERDTGRPIMLDAVRTLALPIRLSDGTPRALYRQLKRGYR